MEATEAVVARVDGGEVAAAALVEDTAGGAEVEEVVVAVTRMSGLEIGPARTRAVAACGLPGGPSATPRGGAGASNTWPGGVVAFRG